MSRLVIVASNNKDKLDDFVTRCYNNGKKTLDLRSYTKDRMQPVLEVLSRNIWEGDMILAVGNATKRFVRKIEKIFSGIEVVVHKVAEYRKIMGLVEYDIIQNVSLRTDVISMIEWESKIEDALNAVDASLYKQQISFNKLAADI